MSEHKTQEWVDKLELQNALRFAEPGACLITQSGVWFKNEQREWHWRGLGNGATNEIPPGNLIAAYAGKAWSIS